MLRVGLTGGIASGKSHVRRRLEAAGLATLDLDTLSHRVTAPGGAAYADVVAAFGPAILAPGGAIDRKALGAVVFADPAARARLNALVHPRVREEEERAAAALAPGPEAVLVVDAALLVEAGVHLRFDRLVVVYCPPEEQLRRLRARDGLGEGAARDRLQAQMDAREKRRFAHFDIDASGAVEDTDRQVDALVPELRLLAGRPLHPEPPPRARALGSLREGPARVAGGPAIARWLAFLAAAERLEMPALASQLAPGPAGPWYLAGRRGAGGEAAAAAMVPVVLWSLARRGPDTPWLCGAAASVARLTHGEPAAVAGAVLFAQALEEVLRRGALEALGASLAGWSDAAARWAGAPPQREVVEAVAEAAAGGGARGTLAGALRGAAGGAEPGPDAPELHAGLDALGVPP
jgi:dephospho-CoA kinase